VSTLSKRTCVISSSPISTAIPQQPGERGKMSLTELVIKSLSLGGNADQYTKMILT
jgi:hypothetical protein